MSKGIGENNARSRILCVVTDYSNIIIGSDCGRTKNKQERRIF